MQLFYHPQCDTTTEEVRFSKEESRHITKVLRKRVGDHITLTNGTGWIFTLEITSDHPKECAGQVIETQEQAPMGYELHLAVAPTKNNDRFEWFLEKATEIGITSITPILCDHSERKVIKAERFEKILQTAMKQSLRAYLPKLQPMTSFSDFIQQSHAHSKRMIAHCEEVEKSSLKQALQPGNNGLILIGPEGDFSESEITQAAKAGFTPITLGDSRLRTETAALVACQNVAFINQ